MELSVGDLRQLIGNGPAYAASNGDVRRLGIQIVVLHRGWVVVGETAIAGDEVHVAPAKCIRRWGTTKGLGEIAASGPLPSTILDEMGSVVVHRLGVVLMIACNPEKWHGR